MDATKLTTTARVRVVVVMPPTCTRCGALIERLTAFGQAEPGAQGVIQAPNAHVVCLSGHETFLEINLQAPQGFWQRLGAAMKILNGS